MSDKLRETLVSEINNGALVEEEDQQLTDSKQECSKRKSSSLSLVTKQFVEQIRREKDMTICLNDAMKKMNLKKRRLYDIANVLQGIGYVRKDMRNHLKWIGGGEDPQKTVQLHFLKDYFKQLKETQRQINQEIQNAQKTLLNTIQQNQENQKFLTVSMQDCEQVRNYLNKCQNISRDQYSVLIFQVPKDTQIWSQVERQTGLYSVKLETQHGEINSYLIEPGQHVRKCNKLDF